MVFINNNFGFESISSQNSINNNINNNNNNNDLSTSLNNINNQMVIVEASVQDLKNKYNKLLDNLTFVRTNSEENNIKQNLNMISANLQEQITQLKYLKNKHKIKTNNSYNNFSNK